MTLRLLIQSRLDRDVLTGRRCCPGRAERPAWQGEGVAPPACRVEFRVALAAFAFECMLAKGKAVGETTETVRRLEIYEKYPNGVASPARLPPLSVSCFRRVIRH